MNARPIDPKVVISVTEHYYHLPAGSLVEKNATNSIRDARSVAVYLLSTEARLSGPEIADMMHRDQSTIRFSLNSTKKKLRDPEFAARFNDIRLSFSPQLLIY